MERRKAIKNIGYGSAALFSSSLLFGSLQSCTATPKVDWIPVFFTPEEAAQMEKICEGIAPKTTTPGAIEAGVPAHLDEAFSIFSTADEASYFKRGLAVFVDNFKDNGEVSFNKATTEQVTDVINAYYKRYNDQPDILKNYRETYNDPGEKSDEFVEAHFVTSVVDATFRSYFTSELVGETVMRYDPIPVKYEGCIPYEAGQKSWSSV
ncbi:gluconate 2-dehydrogenase subunit 3 family protein [Roseivirga misakiensis]|uniref:Gluconate 2-dehydrogenase subunit 3 family protein n=1 Tax=Roseivirga misakiensis TaxID=1563681 RepID=A0A1E5T4J0_9BACT|nr:gluconate 2-dehydrogenase subunit 3 family protein [Roseivirga misakiensis]OEK06299.1 hypothetical protein BFP71_01075 [Roseivirga misakiensis]